MNHTGELFELKLPAFQFVYNCIPFNKVQINLPYRTAHILGNQCLRGIDIYDSALVYYRHPVAEPGRLLHILRTK